MAELEVEITGDISDLNRKLNQTQRKLSETGKSFNTLNEFAVGALSGIAAAFSIGAIVNFGKAVLDTTAKFQKFEAVLSNTLGSESKAQQALIQIQQFASQTPFAVDELTSAFVKLANQGFRPTVNELRSLGDLAASTGKSFDQLAEAIIDAQVGEFERLKEFGIRAKVEGENVTFAFKGVETQVLNSSEAIRGYILSLGEAEGVSGSMAKISETLGGKISNLGDNIEQLKLAIGDQTSGVFAASIDWLNEFINLATLAAKGVAQIREEASVSKIGAVIKANRDQVLELADAYQKINPDLTRQGALAKAIADVSRSFRAAAEGGQAFVDQNYTMSELDEIIEGFNSLSIELLNISNSTKKATEETTKQVAKTQELKRVFEDIANLPSAPALPTNPFSGGLPELPQPTGVDTSPRRGVNFFDQLLEDLNEKIPTIEERLRTFAFNVQDILRNEIALSFEDLGLSIGEALASGGNVIEAIGQSLLRSIGAFLGQLGKQLIAFGAAGLAFGKLSLALTNPLTAIKAAPLAIAAGIALTIAAGAIGSIGRQGLGGTGSGVGSTGQSQTFGGSGAFLTPSDFFSNVTFEIEGTKLVGVIGNTRDRYSKG